MRDVRNNPHDFIWLCRTCHNHVEHLHDMNPEKRDNILEIVSMTNT